MIEMIQILQNYLLECIIRLMYWRRSSLLSKWIYSSLCFDILQIINSEYMCVVALWLAIGFRQFRLVKLLFCFYPICQTNCQTNKVSDKSFFLHFLIMTLHKTKNILPQIKPSVPKMLQNNVVYKITCPRCESSYVGQTTRPLQKRF